MRKVATVVARDLGGDVAGSAARGNRQLRIADCGLRIFSANPQSEIRNPKLRQCLPLLLAMLGISCAAPRASAQDLRQMIQDAAAAVQSGSLSQPLGEQPQAPPARSGPGGTTGPAEGLPIPPQRVEGRLPLAGSNSGDVKLSQKPNGNIDLVVRDASLSRVLATIAQTQQLNIVAANDIDALISITLRDVPLEEALTAILSVANYTWVQRGNIILITSLSPESNLAPDVQGRELQVFELDFASARIVSEAISGFLSPIGKVSVISADSTNNKLTRELIVVEDLPASLARIASYIHQVDQPPRQVQIEAHILQVTLDDTCRCGVNLQNLIRISGETLDLQTVGLANPDAPQAFIATLTGGDLGAVIEAIQTTNDTKTLGSPKLLVLNEQQARLQVGKQLGFRVTTTTETSTVESVQMLDVGVILDIIPRITRDGRVMMKVKPQVSDGLINPETGLPEEETTELESDVMLRNGEGMIVGGLIKETDQVQQQKVPYLGEVKGIGWLFRRTERKKERVEILVALVPRIQPYDCEWASFEQGELVKTGVELFHGALHRNNRPWDPVLPDGKRVYRPLIPKLDKGRRLPAPDHGYYSTGEEYVIPKIPMPQQRVPEQCQPWACEEPVMFSPGMAMPEQEMVIPDQVMPMPDQVQVDEAEPLPAPIPSQRGR